MALTESRQKALNRGWDLFSASAGNPLYQKWREHAIGSFDFYDGVGQYHPEILEILHQRNQSPIVVNKVRSIVNNASGLEINTRGKIAFRPQSNSEEEEKLTKGMTHYGYAVQKDQQFSFKGSLRCRDALVCGLGWSKMYSYRNQILYDYIHPLNVIFDADDSSPQLTNMRHIIYMHWLTAEEIKSYWPKHARKLDEISNYEDMYNDFGNFTPEFFNRRSALIPTSYTEGMSGNGSRLLVNEIFQKEKRKYYCGLDKNGYYFETFEEEDAEKLADKKSDIVEEMGTQIMRTVFCNDILLEYGPMLPNTPNRKDFSLIPCVWQRRTSDGVPIGWIEDFKDLQRQFNYYKLKEIMSLNSARARIDVNAIQGMSADEIRAEISRPDGILFTTGAGQVDIIPNIDISSAMIKASERLDYEFQQVSGMYNESMGAETNAQSGVAIKQRQIGTSRNLAFGFDTFQHVKEREGKVLIELLQGSGLENILVNIVMDDDEKETFIMNLVRDVDGKQHMFNDIRTLPVDIYVEIVPDYDSSFEEQRATLETLLANPQAPLILQNPYLLKILLGERHADKIAEAMQQLNQEQMAQQNGAVPGGGMPPPQMDLNPTQLGAT